MVGGMKRLALAVGLLIASPVMAQEFPFRGQWEVRHPDATYLGIVLIDGERRVTWDSPNDGGKPAIARGFAIEPTGGSLMLVLTNGAVVAKTYCDVRSSNLLHCHTARQSGMRSDNYMLVKTGPGPHRLTQPSR